MYESRLIEVSYVDIKNVNRGQSKIVSNIHIFSCLVVDFMKVTQIALVGFATGKGIKNI